LLQEKVHQISIIEDEKEENVDKGRKVNAEMIFQMHKEELTGEQIGMFIDIEQYL
jgi:hypothetical protein